MNTYNNGGKWKLNSDYQICTRCVMDTSDPEITFDNNRVCNHCHAYDNLIYQKVFSGESAEVKLNKVIQQIKKDGMGKDYDCVIGISGGVDSSFVAYKVKQLGLRPFAIHLDNGWNSELSVKNVEKIINGLGIDLYTYTINWEEFRDLQLSFLKSSTPDCEIPTDHAIVAIMRQMAKKLKVRHIISGCNVKTETHLPRSWSQGHRDWKYISSIQSKFGRTPLKTYPHMNFLTYHYLTISQNWFDILNYVDYSKTDAVAILQKEFGWQNYGGKHYESIYTRFLQGYILPKKFGYDKRRSHLSSLICSGEITRHEALLELDKPAYPIYLQKEDREYVIKKIGINEGQFNEIMNRTPKSYNHYPNYSKLNNAKIYRWLKSLYQKK